MQKESHMVWTLKQILDHETGDSWNGTHYRNLSVQFNAKSQIVTVVSENEMHPGEIVKADFGLDDVKAQVKSGELSDARYFGAFAAASKGVLPGINVNGLRPGAFLKHVDHVSFD
jgi:hypothetical protein